MTTLVTIGPFSPGTAANSGGTPLEDWTNPTNATAEDDTYAVSGSVLSSGTSSWLMLTNFGITVPADVSIATVKPART